MVGNPPLAYARRAAINAAAAPPPTAGAAAAAAGFVSAVWQAAGEFRARLPGHAAAAAGASSSSSGILWAPCILKALVFSMGLVLLYGLSQVLMHASLVAWYNKQLVHLVLAVCVLKGVGGFWSVGVAGLVCKSSSRVKMSPTADSAG